MKDVVFLDANALFSAAWKPLSPLLRLWELKNARLGTSDYAYTEAWVNLPGEDQRERLEKLAATIRMVAEIPEAPLPKTILLPEKDRPILQAALAMRATHLLTGDFRHFGAYFGRTIGGALILTPGEYLKKQLPGG